jgi:hypothetical protein
VMGFSIDPCGAAAFLADLRPTPPSFERRSGARAILRRWT